LLQTGQDLTLINSRNCDLTEATSLSRFDHDHYDQIYHLAAWTQAGDFCLHHPAEQWIINQRINTNVLDWWQRRQPQAKLICMGTSCAYDPEMSLVEGNYLAGSPIESLFTYAMTKRMLYVGVRAIGQQRGLRYLCVVPSTLYGPGYHTDARQMHFIFDLIRKILSGKLYGHPVVLWGDGYQRRELVYIDDFVTTLIRLSALDHNELINVGAGEEFSIVEFANLICANVGYNSDLIQFDSSKYVGARSKCLDIHKLKSFVPNYSPTPLVEGLANTITWFERQKELLTR
jgi:GDP-L-fucose synthase